MVYAFAAIPPFLRDLAYNWLAGRRYRWFGRRDACMVPAQDVLDRYLPD